MACYHPVTAWQALSGGPLIWVERGDCRQVTIACGQCVGCRLEKSRQWAVRCMHESQMHKDNCHLTLTYDDEHLPQRYLAGYDRRGVKKYAGNLVYRDFQLFMKKLRVFFYPSLIRFFVAGEYGEEFARPHFHACVFGVDFADKVFHRTSDAGSKIYVSSSLNSLWANGYGYIGTVNFASAAYTARYIMKKVNGDLGETHYLRTCIETGEVIRLVPEFIRMSLKPGIGASWLAKFVTDVYPHGKVSINGVEAKAPRFYDKQVDLSYFEDLQFAREVDGKRRFDDNSDERLRVKEEVAKARLQFLKRGL